MESVELRTISSRQKCVVCMLGVKVLRKKYAERESSQMEIRKKIKSYQCRTDQRTLKLEVNMKKKCRVERRSWKVQV